MIRFGIGTLKFRLITLFVLLFGSILILFSFLLYNDFVATHKREFDNALYNYTVDVADALTVDVFGDLSLREEFLNDQEKIFPFALGKTQLFLRDNKGKILARSSNAGKFDPKIIDEDWKLIKANKYHFRTVDYKGKADLRVLTYPVKVAGTPEFILQAAAPRTLLESEQKGLLTFFSVAIPLVMLLAGFLGLLVAQNALRPIGRIIQSANAIEAEDLRQRVPMPPSRDEIYALAETINNLLARLENAFVSQERFIADASHQLKTPLAILRGELDLTLKKQRSPEEMDVFLKSMSQEITHLSQMVEDLLILARTDAKVESFKFETVRIDEILLEEISRLEKLGREKNVKLTLNIDSSAKQFEILGDLDLLKCLFHNIIENGIKYSPPGEAVETRVWQNANSLNVDIKDKGPGIMPEETDKIFERFHRSATLKNLNPGAGLGLAVAKKIADLHGAQIHVKSDLGLGSTFTVEIKNF